MKKFFKWLGIVLAILFIVALLFNKKKEQNNQLGFIPPANNYQSRSFYMGFTPWPLDLTNEGVKQAYDFLHQHADIVAHHFDGGLPWQEALDGKAFPKHLQDDWNFRKSQTLKTQKIYLAITPVNFERTGLAQNWGENGDSQPLAEPWGSYRLNDEHVKQAFFNYAKRAVEFFKPDYLAIGIETNIIISKAPDKWQDYLELNAYVYNELKKDYPKLPVFSTVQYEHLRGIENEAKKNVKQQQPGVQELLKHSDLLALSTYRFGLDHNPYTADYFKPALAFNKPLAISETGGISKEVNIFGNKLRASEEDQKNYLSMILQQAQEHKFVFVINWVAIDYDRLLEKLPAGPIQEIAKAWVHTGLVSSDGKNKPPLGVWDSYYKLPKK